MELGAASAELACRPRRRARRRPRGRRRGGGSARCARAEGRARRRRAGRERLRDRDAVRVRAPAPRRGRARRGRSGTRRATRSRKAAFRPFASSSVTSRSGSAAASGMPGAPPPEPTSTIGPSIPLDDGEARRAIARRARAMLRQGRGSRSVPESRGASESSGGAARSVTREDDNVAVRLGALALRRDARLVLQPQVDDLALRPRSSARARPARRSSAPAPRLRSASDSSVARRRSR